MSFCSESTSRTMVIKTDPECDGTKAALPFYDSPEIKARLSAHSIIGERVQLLGSLGYGG